MEPPGAVALENHSRTVVSADDALDFNFNESDAISNDSNENELHLCCHCLDNFCSIIFCSPHQLGRKISNEQLVPFVHHFQQPLKPKDLLLVEGTVLKYAKGFKIDLCSAKNEVVFHLNPRLDQKYLARNSWLEGAWGLEEGTSLAPSPVQRAKSFQVQIYVLEKEFLVAINGEHMFSFSHRLPFQEISRIEVFGDVDIANIYLTKTPVYPLPGKNTVERPHNDLRLPLLYFMKHGIGRLGKISIEGRVKLLPVSFTINIQETDEVFPHPKIIYHLNGRYSSDSVIVENSWGLRGHSWDQEVRARLPRALAPGSKFSLNIITTNAHIQTRGVDWQLPPFRHRINPDSGRYLSIQGDLILSSLQVYPDHDTIAVF